jgi:low affinity Fe/Cu permease
MKYILRKILEHSQLRMTKKSITERLADLSTKWAGSAAGFNLAFGSIAIWTVGGFYFGFTDTYQLVINTGTTIVTFLMVFLIQRSQNKEILSLHIKLDELIKASANAQNKIIVAEQLSEVELRELYNYYTKKIAKTDNECVR